MIQFSVFHVLFVDRINPTLEKLIINRIENTTLELLRTNIHDGVVSEIRAHDDSTLGAVIRGK